MKKTILIILTIYFVSFLSIISIAQTPKWLWENRAGSTCDDMARSIAVDASGNIYVAGHFMYDSIIFGFETLKNAGSEDIFLVKYNAGGNVIWARRAGGISNDFGISVAVDASGSIYMAGNFMSSSITFDTITLTNTFNSSAYLAKYDAGGNVLWVKKAGGKGDYDVINSVAVDASNNIYVAGFFDGSTITFGTDTLKNEKTGFQDIFLAKYNSNGNVIWAKRMGGKGSDAESALATDASGNIYLTGTFISHTIGFDTDTLTNTGGNDVFLAKFNANGNVLWAKSASGAGDDYPTSIATSASGIIYLTGYFESSAITFGSDTLKNIGNKNIFFTKYNTNGNIVWVKSAGGTYADFATSVTVDAHGDCYLTGYFQSTTIAFGSHILTNADSFNNTSDIFLVKYDGNGNVIWVKSPVGAGNEWTTTMAIDFSGNIYLAGEFDDPYLLFGSDTLNNAGYGGFFLAKLNLGLGVTELINPLNITVFPNPATNYITIRSQHEGIIEISNIQGQLMKTIKTSGNTTNIDVSLIPGGIYFVELKTGKGVAGKLFLKE